MIPGPPRMRRLDHIAATLEDGLDPDPNDATWMYHRLLDVDRLAKTYARLGITYGRTLDPAAAAAELMGILYETDDDNG